MCVFIDIQNHQLILSLSNRALANAHFFKRGAVAALVRNAVCALLLLCEMRENSVMGQMQLHIGHNNPHCVISAST